MSNLYRRKFIPTKTWYEDADKYWKTVPSSIDGMLGGLEVVHSPDVRDSLKFLAKILSSTSAPVGSAYACDCGSGIGRVTKHVLLDHFDKVDLVEQNEKFLDTATNQYLKEEVDSGRVCNMFATGLQDFTPTKGKYNVIWCQWVLSHLTNSDMVALLRRCASGLAPNGLVCVKESIARQGYIIDQDDSSVTRTESIFERIFNKANMEIVEKNVQTELPQGCFVVKMWALRPKIAH
ncbi:methyltransferase like 11A-like protein [Coemansia reversa NRRL 1564]|uniref:Alpha N-terminal protein methyltransferase 1 n=1 Tax=Coemansia reversa (strain ATCC 12441 / NRRL 1564) TaxID=763665 RepID=A0A2G5BHK5_COERN|nr:methyltransferase like 11A-like protein [Coemansia reversa NRRL 1564]|eukprot:PIA18475.1 methyltransferase like 11A-like protein [Coemansia reversa NRRL 1564]